MSSNFKPPEVMAITDAMETGARVSELLSAGNVRAIIIDMRQSVLVAHFEDNSPKDIPINGESIPYLLGAIKIIPLSGTFLIPDAQKELINYAKKHNLDPKTYISSDFLAESLKDVDLPVLSTGVLVDNMLLLVMGPKELESLAQCTLVAAYLE